jgi:hypothetical protein
MSDYIHMTAGENYERITNLGGVKTTICKNRFEVICQPRAEVNEERAVAELKAWIAKRREEEMRDAGDMPGTVS